MMGQPEMTETSRAVWEAEIFAQLDAYGAPPGDTIEDRLRAWEQRERALRMLAKQVQAWNAEGRPQTLAYIIVDAARNACGDADWFGQ